MFLYLILTYSLAWAWWIPLALTHSYVKPGFGWPTHLIGLASPAIATFIVVAKEKGFIGIRDLFNRIKALTLNKLTSVLIISTLIFAFAPVYFDSSIGFSDLGKYSGAPDKGFLSILLILILNGYGEEIGWRVYVAEKFLADRNIAKTAGRVWLAWAPWHFPLFFVVDTYRQMNLIMIFGWLVSIYFGSVVLTWLYFYSNRSLLVVVLWHISYNLSVATAASKGFTSSLVSMLVILGAIFILRVEYRRDNLRHEIN